MLHSQHGSTAGDPDYRRRAARAARDAPDAVSATGRTPRLAAAIQHVLEREVARLIAANVPRIDGQPIALAGGVFANVKLNKLVKEMGFGKIFVQPAMGDGGLAFGAPLMALAERNGGLRPTGSSTCTSARRYDDAAIERALRAAGLPARRFDCRSSRRSRALLADGRVVARFDGRMEFGPRALGNRSILYHGSDPGVNDWLNKRLERTEFMPFAPATLEDEAEASFLGLAGAEHAAEFMTIIFDCSE